MQAGLSKDTRSVIPWIPSIRTHFWFCAEHCGGDSVKFKVNQNDCEWVYWIKGLFLMKRYCKGRM